jgi:hypothetical protein
LSQFRNLNRVASGLTPRLSGELEPFAQFECGHSRHQQMVRVDVAHDRDGRAGPGCDLGRQRVGKVNAVIYFRVMDLQKTIIQAENFFDATSQLAQTTRGGDARAAVPVPAAQQLPATSGAWAATTCNGSGRARRSSTSKSYSPDGRQLPPRERAREA